MSGVIRDIDFGNFEEGFPALLTLTLMPFTYSITNGIGAAFIAYTFIKLATGKARTTHPLLWGVALAFVVYVLIPLIQLVFGM